MIYVRYWIELVHMNAISTPCFIAFTLTLILTAINSNLPIFAVSADMPVLTAHITLCGTHVFFQLNLVPAYDQPFQFHQIVEGAWVGF